MKNNIQFRDVANMLIAYRELSEHERRMREYEALPFVSRLFSRKPVYKYDKVFPSTNFIKDGVKLSLEAYLADFNHNIFNKYFLDVETMTLEPKFESDGRLTVKMGKKNCKDVFLTGHEVEYDVKSGCFHSLSSVMKELDSDKLIDRMDDMLKDVTDSIAANPECDSGDLLVSYLNVCDACKHNADIRMSQDDRLVDAVHMVSIQSPTVEDYCRCVNRQRELMEGFNDGTISPDSIANVSLYKEYGQSVYQMLDNPSFFYSLSDIVREHESLGKSVRPSLRELKMWTDTNRRSAESFAGIAFSCGYKEKEIKEFVDSFEYPDMEKGIDDDRNVIISTISSSAIHSFENGTDITIDDVCSYIESQGADLNEKVDVCVRDFVQEKLNDMPLVLGEVPDDRKNFVMLEKIASSAYDKGIDSDRLCRIMESMKVEGRPVLQFFPGDHPSADLASSIVGAVYDGRTVARMDVKEMKDSEKVTMEAYCRSDNNQKHFIGELVRQASINGDIAKELCSSLGVKGESHPDIVKAFGMTRVLNETKGSALRIFKDIQAKYFPGETNAHNKTKQQTI